MGRLLLLFVLWLLQAGLVVVLVNAQWIEEQMQRERVSVRRYLGANTDARLEQSSTLAYQRWFVQTGAVAAGYERLLPDPSVPKDGLEGLAPWWFKWFRERLDAFWWMVYQSLYRLLLIQHWLPYITLLVLAAVVDGLTQRSIKRVTFGYASSDRYVVAKRILLILGFAPLVYFAMPLNVHPIVVPIWGGALTLAFILLIANAQHRV